MTRRPRLTVLGSVLGSALVAVSLALATLAVPARSANAATGFDRSNRVVLVGDSSLAGMRWYQTTETLRPYDFVFNAESCRRVVGLSCRGREGYAPSNGLDALRSHAGQVGDTVVAMMGYNDAGANFGTAVDQFVTLAQQLGAQRVVWLTFKTDVSYVGPTFAANDATYRSNNRILEEKKQAYGDRLLLADWNTIGRANPSWFEADGVHLTRAGATALGGFIRTSLDTMAPSRCSAKGASQGAAPGTPSGSPDTDAAGLELVAPRRLVDTRQGAPVAAGTALRVQLSDAVPDDATAVLVNVTATDPCEAGVLTAHDCSQAVPSTSNVNVAASGSRSTMALVPVSGGDLCIFSLRRTDVVVDVFGYASPGSSSRLAPVAPVRLLDTRSGNAVEKTTGDLVGGRDLSVATANVPGRPAGATGAVLTVTAVAGGSAGWLAAFPCDAPSLTSVVNFEAGQVVANAAPVRLAANGTVCLRSNVALDAVLDVTGWVAPTGARLTPAAPTRLVDTRTGQGGGRSADGATLRITVPGSPAAAVLTVTAVDSSASGFATVWPCAQARPLASNLNVNGREIRSNLVVTPTSDGQVCVYTQRATDLVVDQFGTFA